MASVYSIDPAPGASTFAVVLAYALSRSHPDLVFHGRLETAASLPMVGMAARGVGFLLLHLLWVGEIVFVIGIGFSIWMRRLGHCRDVPES